MNKENAHLYLPLVQALADGETIEIKRFYCGKESWQSISQYEIKFDFCPDSYRIKTNPAGGDWGQASDYSLRALHERNEASDKALVCMGNLWADLSRAAADDVVRLERELFSAHEKRDMLSVVCYTWEDNWKILAKERDVASEQRDKLADVLLALRDNESFSIGVATYEIIEQALQAHAPKHSNQLK